MWEEDEGVIEGRMNVVKEAASEVERENLKNKK